jgi:riboflavin biosynthesis pyrimidine reductase
MMHMSRQKLPDLGKVTQVFPEERQVPLEGLYLGQRLADISARIGRPLVITDYLCDRNGVIAKADEHHEYQVPLETRNASDWRLFQELMAQADVILIGAAYLRRVVSLGSRAQSVLSQFEPGREFEELGGWRLSAGYKLRSPDLAIVSHGLDFRLPEGVTRSGRKVMVFTTNASAVSDQAGALTASGAVVVGSGEAGVEGNPLIDYLSSGMGYRVIMMATGPRVLQLLLEANRLDLIYVTEAQVEIPFVDPSTVQKILPEGKKVRELEQFSLVH